MTKKPHNDNRPWWAIIPGVLVLMIAAAMIGFGCLYGSDFGAEKPAPLTPGELVDKAMAMPGAIVLSPHRDLVEMGITSSVAVDSVTDEIYSPEIHLCSPAIAIHTKKKWCVWELGAKCGFNLKGYIHHAEDYVSIHGPLYENGSIDGYQAAFTVFQKCVSEGNSVDIKASGIKPGLYTIKKVDE